MQNIITTSQEVCKLIRKAQKKKLYTLNKKEKINFAYGYWQLTNIEMPDLYYLLATYHTKETKNLAQRLGYFMNSQRITKTPVFQASILEKDLSSIEAITEAVKNNGNWLGQYDLEEEFEKQSKYNHPIIYKYLMEDETIFTIDKERAAEVLGILIEGNIPTAKCIVTGAFPYYASDNMDEYIEQLQKTKK